MSATLSDPDEAVIEIASSEANTASSFSGYGDVSSEQEAELSDSQAAAPAAAAAAPIVSRASHRDDDDDEVSNDSIIEQVVPDDPSIPLQVSHETIPSQSPPHSLRFQTSLGTSTHNASSSTLNTNSMLKQEAAAAAGKRLYRASNTSQVTGTAAAAENSKHVTRDIAALDFLLGIPLAAEASLVQTGWRLQQKQHEEDADMFSIDSSTAFSPSREGDHHYHQHRSHHHHHHAAAAATAANSHGQWWEKHVRSIPHSVDTSNNNNNGPPSMIKSSKQAEQEGELERPNADALAQRDASTAAGAALVVESSTHHHHHRHHGRGGVDGTTTAGGGGVLVAVPAYTPGRRLDGDDAIRIKIPVTTDENYAKTKQKSIARTAAIREWERQTAHGLHASSHPPLLDGRLFFSAAGSYPVSVFSIIRYEPRREQAEFRRKKLESLGGGGSQFVMPGRDWRGISYRVLLPTRARYHKKLVKRKGHVDTTVFNRFVRSSSGGKQNKDDDGKAKKNGGDELTAEDKKMSEDESSSVASDSSGDSDIYVPGMLDDPDMTLGRHHTVMMGDHITGPMVSSTIQFVKPALLKAELNKQFRERFDGWEPPKSSRKYIGAYVNVQEGKYVLNDPVSSAPGVDNDTNTQYDEYSTTSNNRVTTRTRQGSVTSMSSAGADGPKEKPSVLRIPPSLTLSKIRSLKQQALSAAIKAKLEVGTVALACVYFERLCLDCRVDKSNRRLSFAACLLIASKINEPNIRLVMKQETSNNTAAGEDSAADNTSTNNTMKTRIRSLVRPNKRSKNMFASLLEFFTVEWSLSVKNLFDAEWGVFAALGFSLHATPSQVAFHFKRLMKKLEWNPRNYLGSVMWDQWQDALEEEEIRKRERERRRDLQRKRKEDRLLDLQLELENEVMRRHNTTTNATGGGDQGSSSDGKATSRSDVGENSTAEQPDQPPRVILGGKEERHQSEPVTGKKGGMNIFNRFGMKRILSVERFESVSEHPGVLGPRVARRRSSAGGGSLPMSPSMPALHTHENDTNTSAAICIDIPADEQEQSDGPSSLDIMDESDVEALVV